MYLPWKREKVFTPATYQVIAYLGELGSKSEKPRGWTAFWRRLWRADRQFLESPPSITDQP